MPNCIECRKECVDLDEVQYHYLGLKADATPICSKVTIDFIIRLDQRESIDESTMKIEMSFDSNGIGDCHKEGCTSKLCGRHFDRVLGIPKK